MHDASDEAYRQAWSRFADMAKQHGTLQSFRMLIAADPRATIAMFQWMERQPPTEREQLAALCLDPRGNA